MKIRVKWRIQVVMENDLKSSISDEIVKLVDIQEELRVDKWLSSKNFI